MVCIKPNRAEAYSLLHDGILALADIEATGIKIDRAYLTSSITTAREEIRQLDRALKDMPEWQQWRKRFGEKTKLNSNEQLATLLFDVMGHKSSGTTENGGHQADELALMKVGTPFVKKWLERAKMMKTANTYLDGILRETDENDRCHPVFNLHIAITYRSSSDTPNFQNMPVRNKKMMKAIRTAFIPSAGSVIVEHDYSGVEVRVAACYHKDPTMIEYIMDPTKDMHRDMMCQIFKIDPKLYAVWIKQSGKELRNVAKNKFVFPQFYGSTYFQCAIDLWEDAERLGLKAPDGSTVHEWLAKQGVKKLGKCDPKFKAVAGTFEKHLEEVCEDFWNVRFKVYGKWKKAWHSEYKRTGGFATLTGFYISGNMSKNDVINYPVQGSAFHCLLWSVTRINKILRKRKMKSRIVGQIHDSCVADVRIEELDEYMAIVDQVMTKDVMDRFPWLIVPLTIECDITPPNGSWAEKKAVDWKPGKYTINGDDKKEYTFKNALSFTEFLRKQHTASKAA